MGDIATLVVSIILRGTLSLPSFITNTGTQLVLNPITSTAVQVYYIDMSTTVTYSISVTAGNTPPTTTGTFASQSVSLGKTVAYTLPVFTDAQSDPITVTAFDGVTPLTPSSGYVTFNSATNIITFAPTAVLDIGTKTINIFAGDGLATITW